MTRGTFMKSAAVYIIGLIILSSPFSVFAAGIPSGKPPTAYKIEVEFNPSMNLIKVREEATWRNRTEREARELKMHLYLNAFSSDNTLFMRESIFAGAMRRRTPDKFSKLEIKSVVTSDGKMLTDKLKIYESVMTIPLDRPVRPGEERTIIIEYEAKLPSGVWRTGHTDDYFLFQGWFPKFGVFLRSGVWDCRQFHHHTEYFADYGNYRVEISAPDNYILGGTGISEARKENGKPTEWIFTADWVIDFAWTASSKFLKFTENHNGTEIELLLQPFHKGAKGKYYKAVKTALDGYGEWAGEYPYGKITVVDPFPGAGTGGMEYPMFIIGGTSYYRYSVLRNSQSPESITIHEFGHQYFYNLLASNEQKDPWLDEGLNTFVQNMVMKKRMGKRENYTPFFYTLFHSFDMYTMTPEFMRRGNNGEMDIFLMGKEQSGWARRRHDFLRRPHYLDPIRSPGYETYNSSSYRVNAYAKSAILLKTLVNIYGEDAVKSAMQNYYKEFRFSHPTGNDFIGIINRSLGDEAGSIMRTAVESSGIVDYRVVEVESRFEPARKTGSDDDLKRARPVYRSMAGFENSGDIALPVEIEVDFEDGSSWRYRWNTLNGERREFQRWDGFRELSGKKVMIREGYNRNWLKVYFLDESRVVAACVDPGYKIELDVNMANNSFTIKSGNYGAGIISRYANLAFKRLLAIAMFL